MAVSRRFKNFEDLIGKDTQLAVKIIEERVPEEVRKSLFESIFDISGTYGVQGRPGASRSVQKPFF